MVFFHLLVTLRILLNFFFDYFISQNKQNKTSRRLPLLFVLKQMKTNEEALLFSTMKTLEEHSRGLKPEIGARLNFLKSSIHLERWQSINKICRLNVKVIRLFL